MAYSPVRFSAGSLGFPAGSSALGTGHKETRWRLLVIRLAKRTGRVMGAHAPTGASIREGPIRQRST